MTVAEIQNELDKLPENATLTHIWTKRLEGGSDKTDDFETHLYFREGQMAGTIVLKHSKGKRKPFEKYKNDSPKPSEGNFLTTKMKTFFNKEAQ